MPARTTSSLALAAALILGGLWLLSQSFRGREHSQLDRPLRHSPLSHPGHVANVSLTTTRRRKNVAVASSFGAHFDVYMAFVKTLGDVMDEDDMDEEGEEDEDDDVEHKDKIKSKSEDKGDCHLREEAENEVRKEAQDAVDHENEDEKNTSADSS